MSPHSKTFATNYIYKTIRLPSTLVKLSKISHVGNRVSLLHITNHCHGSEKVNKQEIGSEIRHKLAKGFYISFYSHVKVIDYFVST